MDETLHPAYEAHTSIEHYLRVSPTTFSPASLTQLSSRRASPIVVHPFVASTHRHAKEATPAVLLTYDVSPIRVEIVQERMAFSQLILSACAIIGGVVSVVGILDGAVHSGGRALGQFHF
mmetsp:Transcript_11645/g.28348  ORF Transcript_11645/g.28348 Transcript_11645/m.28348 type:complete len:120 (+) Transcript_11645:2-361(+)